MSANLSIQWDRRTLAKLGIRALEPQLLRAGEYLRGRVVRNISVPTSIHGPSKPGQWIRADKGRLRQSIFVRKAPGPMILGVQSSEIRVGTNLKYGLYHEYVSGRSFLRRTLSEEVPRLRALFRGARVGRG